MEYILNIGFLFRVFRVGPVWMCFGNLNHEDGFNFLREITVGGSASVLRDFPNSPKGRGLIWQEQSLGSGDAELFIPQKWHLRAHLPSRQG